MVKKIKKKLNSNISKYSNSSIIKKKFVHEEDALSDEYDANSEDGDLGDDSEDDSFDESENPEEFGENQEFNEFGDNEMENGEPIIKTGHLRSNGLFKNIWWKKGVLKGFSIWLCIAIIFHFFDLVGLVEVIDWKRWLFFLILLVLLALTYEKFLAKRTI